MKVFIMIFFIAILSASSQILVKSRLLSLGLELKAINLFDTIINYIKLFSDVFFMFAIVLSFISAALWLAVINKTQLGYSFALYHGLLLVLTAFGSFLFLNEQFTTDKILGILLITIGTALLLRNNLIKS